MELSPSASARLFARPRAFALAALAGFLKVAMKHAHQKAKQRNSRERKAQETKINNNEKLPPGASSTG